MKRLYVLYRSGLKCPGSDSVVLSFMPPDIEQKATALYPGLLFGRLEMDAIREKARRKYVDIVSRIAATPCNGMTLRQALDISGMGNPWWYHVVSEKQVEKDDTFNVLLQIFTVLHVAEREGVNEITVCGAPIEITRVLNSRYKTDGIECDSSCRYSIGRAFLSRLKYLATSFFSYGTVCRNTSLPDVKPDIVFQGFWDWSVKPGGKDGRIDDKYFKSLPDKLGEKGMRCAWLLWLDYSYNRDGDRGSMRRALRATERIPGLVFVQKFLKPRDIVSVIFDLRPLFGYLKYSRSDNFKALFRDKGCDLWPLFESILLYGFCNSSMPHSFLMETAYKRAFEFYKPKMSFAFLEFYVASRAFNQGALSGSRTTIRCDVQHASYAREKTFILADPDKEICGKPDGRAMPIPQNFFVMGELCRDILVEDGISPDKVFLTGSTRYDHLVRDGVGGYRESAPGPKKVLIVATLNVNLDIEMVRAASIASEGLDIKLCLRSHPLLKMEEMPAYKQYSRNIMSSGLSLEDDLKTADLILFIYSTVAEEAFLKGVPILKWCANGFNGSVFGDIDGIPRAYSVESLRKLLRGFLSNPALFSPDEKLKDMVLRKCFYRMDGLAASRIAEKASQILEGRCG